MPNLQNIQNLCMCYRTAIAINLSVVNSSTSIKTSPVSLEFLSEDVAHKALKQPHNGASLLKLSTFAPFSLLLV